MPKENFLLQLEEKKRQREQKVFNDLEEIKEISVEDSFLTDPHQISHSIDDCLRSVRQDLDQVRGSNDAVNLERSVSRFAAANS